MDVISLGRQKMRIAIPLVFLFGVVPPFFLVWVTWRILTAALPSRIFRLGDDCFYSTYQRCINFFVEYWSGSKIILHGDVDKVFSRKEKVIYISNHQSTLDWIISNLLAERQGSMGHVRYVMKDSLQLIPLFGYYFYEHGCVYVKRGNFSQEKMKAALRHINDMDSTTWLTIYPEGTRFRPNNEDLIEKSQNFAIEQGYEPFKHLLTPRVRGLQIALDHLREYIDAVYDVTIIYSNTKDVKTGARITAPSMFEFLSGICPEVHIHVRRLDIKSVPSGSEDLLNWLFDVFRHKDSLLESYYCVEDKEGLKKTPFGSEGVVTFSQTWPTVGAYAFMMTLCLPFYVTSSGRSLLWKTIVYGSLSCYAWLAVKSAA